MAGFGPLKNSILYGTGGAELDLVAATIIPLALLCVFLMLFQQLQKWFRRRVHFRKTLASLFPGNHCIKACSAVVRNRKVTLCFAQWINT